MNNKTSSEKLLCIFQDFIHNLSDEDYKLLLTSKASIILDTSTAKQKKTHKPKALAKNFCEFEKTLSSCENRDKAQSLFDKNKLTKRDLISIAKSLNIHVLSNDRKDIIINKLIEGTVGVKLKSKVIESLDLNKK
ncbi:hypothetical protein [Clostridium sp. DL1XJH146]